MPSLTAKELHLKMFGCPEETLKQYVDDRIFRGDRPPIIAMSILSDAQETTSPVLARQFINRAKWVIANYW